MIQVNLLPSKKPSKARPSKAQATGAGEPAAASSSAALGLILTFVILVVSLSVSAFSGWKVYKEHRDLQRDATTQKNRVQDLEKTVETLEEEAAYLAEMEEQLQNEIAVLRNLSPPDRIIWAEKLNQLAAMRPPNIYIQTVEVTEEVWEVETEAYRRALAEYEEFGKRERQPVPERETRPVMQQHLRIEAIAYTRDALDRQGLMMRFYNKMKDYEQPRPPAGTDPVPFMLGLQLPISIPLYRDELVDGVAVGSFVFEISAKQREG